VASGYRCLVLDLGGRVRTWQPLVDAGLAVRWNVVAAPTDAESLHRFAVEGEPVVVLDYRGLDEATRSLALERSLSAAREVRAATGRPHSIVVDDAELLLEDPALPPEALRLDERGHCLVLRCWREPPDGLARSVDVVVP
jgi:hypothetical protein